MNKRFVAQYARYVAVEERVLTQDLSDKLNALDETAIRAALERKISTLESPGPNEEFRKTQADSIREVMKELASLPD